MSEAQALARIRNTEMEKATQDCLRAAAYAGWVTGHRPAYQRRAAAAYQKAADRYQKVEMSVLARECYRKASELYARGGRLDQAADCALRAEACPMYWDESFEVGEQ